MGKFGLVESGDFLEAGKRSPGHSGNLNQNQPVSCYLKVHCHLTPVRRALSWEVSCWC